LKNWDKKSLKSLWNKDTGLCGRNSLKGDVNHKLIDKNIKINQQKK